jgi:NAD(P)H-dependent FMN reductase
MPRLAVIIGSTRPGRSGLAIGQWFVRRAREHGGFDVQLVDLAELALPLLDEPEHPRLGRYAHEHTRRWSRLVAAADALVIVTPEYNHGYPAALKNALDYLSREWRHKPVGFVSYGGVAAGTRAVQQLKPVVTALQMMPSAESVAIPFHTQAISGGMFHPSAAIEQSADAMLDELLRTEAVLRPAREFAPAA